MTDAPHDAEVPGGPTAPSDEEFEALIEERIAELRSTPGPAAPTGNRLAVDRTAASDLAVRAAAALKRFTGPEAATPGAPGVAWEELEDVARALDDADAAEPATTTDRPDGASLTAVRSADPETGETTFMLRDLEAAGGALFLLTLAEGRLAGVEVHRTVEGSGAGIAVVSVSRHREAWIVTDAGRPGTRVRVDDGGGREPADAAGLRRRPDIGGAELYERLTGTPMQRLPGREDEDPDDPLAGTGHDPDATLAELDAHDRETREFSAFLERAAGEVLRAAERAARRRMRQRRRQEMPTSPDAPDETAADHTAEGAEVPAADAESTPPVQAAGGEKSDEPTPGRTAEPETGEDGPPAPGPTPSPRRRKQFCTKCGARRRGDDAFCTRCGKPF